MPCFEKYIVGDEILERPCKDSIISKNKCLAGSELKALLSSIGITSSPTCSCNSRANEMDRNGCDWCEQNIDLIVGWLREEATIRGLPFIDIAAKILVKRAINNARRNKKG